MLAPSLILFLAAPLFALPDCAGTVLKDGASQCSDPWLKIPRWASYRAPQSFGPYSGPNSALGEAVSLWAKTRGELQVYEGPVFPILNGAARVPFGVDGRAVPPVLWAFAVAPSSSGVLQSLAVMLPASAAKVLPAHLTSIDAIEAATGVDFLGELADGLEASLESATARELWGEERPAEPPPPPPLPPAPPPPAATPSLKPPTMTDAQWSAQLSFAEGTKLFQAGNKTAAREAFTKCLELDENRQDCSSWVMRTFGGP